MLSPASFNPGESSETTRDLWTVTRLSLAIREALQGNPRLQGIWLEGEINNLVYHTSGHIYFSLKDRESTISCTFFKGVNQRFNSIRLADGMKVLVRGGVSTFAPRGSYQFNVQYLTPAGEGELRLKIEQLKNQLFKEGLFDTEKKKKLPVLPINLGVATAPTGAAFQDIIRVSRSRFPGINILLAPCQVQGEGSERSIISAIQILNRPELEIDVIIAGRGGGSFEDLMAFNDENVVRAYAASRVPIISAVGHEIDHPLTDLAADAYAATPSAAAEMAVPVYNDLLEDIEECAIRMKYSLENRHKHEKHRLIRLLKSRIFLEPAGIFQPFGQNLDTIWKDIQNVMRNITGEHRVQLAEFVSLPGLFNHNLARIRSRFELATERLSNFSPLATLQRGYSVVRNAKKQVIRKSSDVKQGDSLEVMLSEGSLEVVVKGLSSQKNS